MTNADPFALGVARDEALAHVVYLLVDVTPERVHGEWHFVDTVRRQGDGVRFAESYEVRRGEHRLRRIGRPVA